MEQTPVGNLPVEIAFQVLQFLENPLDLYSSIRASRQFNTAFATYKTQVLSSVVQNAIHPEILPDAYAACKAPVIAAITHFKNFHTPERWEPETRYDYDSNDMRYYRQTLAMVRNRQLTKFITDYRGWLTGSLPPLTDLPTLISLSRLYNSIQALIKDYKEITFENLPDRVAPPDQPAGSSSFSSRTAWTNTETVRLQRAFFRLEVFFKLFGGRSGNLGWRVEYHSDYVPIALLALFEDWEATEVRWIHYHLRARVDRLFDQIEDTIVRKALKRAIPGSSTRKTGKTCRARKMSPVYQQDRSKERRAQQKQIDFMVSLGLPFLNRLFSSGHKERLRLVGNNCGESNLPCFADILYFSIMRNHAQRTQETFFSSEELDEPSAAWTLGLANEPPLEDPPNEISSWNRDHWNYPAKSGIVLSGLIFWDQPRLEVAQLSSLADANSVFKDQMHRANKAIIRDRLEGMEFPNERHNSDSKLFDSDPNDEDNDNLTSNSVLSLTTSDYRWNGWSRW